MNRHRWLLLLSLSLSLLAACVGPAPRPSPPPVVRKPAPPPVARAPAPASASRSASGTRPQVKLYAPDIKDSAPSADEIPANLASIPDAVPRKEARSAAGNPDEYEAFGEVYHVLDDASGFRQRGLASWYGKKFQGRRTSNGEAYDMYAMTGAHKTLPIPSYVRVTNLDNGKSVVVRINDRGPFHSERIIDLSYTAAAKLELIGHGTTQVELEALVVEDSGPAVASTAPAGALTPVAAVAAPGAAAGGSRLWLQIASFSDRVNALNMRDKLLSLGLDTVSIRDTKNGALHRVVVGPFASDYDAQPMAGRLHSAGYPALRLYD